MNLKQIILTLSPQQESCNEIKELFKQELPGAMDSELLLVIELFKTHTVEDFNEDLKVPITLSCYNSLKGLIINEAKKRGLIPGLTTNEKIVVVLGIIASAGFAAAVILKK